MLITHSNHSKKLIQITQQQKLNLYDSKSKLKPVSNRFNVIWPGGKNLFGAGVVWMRVCGRRAGCWGWAIMRAVGRKLAMGAGLRGDCTPANCPANKPAFWWEKSNGLTKGFNPSHPAQGGTKEPSRTPATFGANLAPFVLKAKLRWVGSWGLMKGLTVSGIWGCRAGRRTGWRAGLALATSGWAMGLTGNGAIGSSTVEPKGAAPCPPDGMWSPSRILKPSFPAEYFTVYVFPSAPT